MEVMSRHWARSQAREGSGRGSGPTFLLQGEGQGEKEGQRQPERREEEQPLRREMSNFAEKMVNSSQGNP